MKTHPMLETPSRAVVSQRFQHPAPAKPVLLLALTGLLLAGCGQATAPAEASNKPGAAATDDAKSEVGEKPDSGEKPEGGEKAEGGEKKEGVTLTAEQVETLGVTVQPAQATNYHEEVTGYGVVLDHQLIAQAVADLRTAEASARFSKASLERAQGLHGTPGAMSADLEQTAEQKAAVDAAALTLTTEKLSSVWGMKPPWSENISDSRVRSVAHGDLQLVKVTFPLGTLTGTPEALQGGRIGVERTEAIATLRPVWTAPADATIPGRSFFTLLPAGTVAEGERLQVWAAIGQPTHGALVPAAAIVLNGGKYWCYVEKTPGSFVRAEVDTSRPTGGGYVVTEEVKPGDKIAITAAGQLLAKETGSTEEPD